MYSYLGPSDVGASGSHTPFLMVKSTSGNVSISRAFFITLFVIVGQIMIMHWYYVTYSMHV